VFRLRVPPSPDEAVVSGCVVPVVAFGAQAASPEITEGREVEVEGALTERRWRGPGGVRQSRFEILARAVRVL
jgi:single-stranded DNA-binding protein